MIETKRIERYVALTGFGLLCVASLLIIKPFLSAVLLAVIFTISTWPVYEYFLRVLRGRKTLAAGLSSLALAALFLVPLGLFLSSFGGEDSATFEKLSGLVAKDTPFVMPEWVVRIPVVGEKLNEQWNAAGFNTKELTARLRPYVSAVTSTALTMVAALGGAVVELCLALLISFFFFRDGLTLAEKLRHGLTKLAGTRAEGLIRTAGNTLKGVVYGIIGTAIAQGVLATIGFALAGVPTPALLGVLTCVLSLVPVGPPLVWIPATLWLFSQGSTVAAVFMLIWGGVVISGSDNIIKPYLISKGSDLPIALIFIGILGGVMQFGFLGVFLGPTILALFYSLVKEWISQPPRQAEAETVVA
jgi:predicted PurR-regulated permease PerM